MFTLKLSIGRAGTNWPRSPYTPLYIVSNSRVDLNAPCTTLPSAEGDDQVRLFSAFDESKPGWAPIISHNSDVMAIILLVFVVDFNLQFCGNEDSMDCMKWVGPED